MRLCPRKKIEEENKVSLGEAMYGCKLCLTIIFFCNSQKEKMTVKMKEKMFGRRNAKTFRQILNMETVYSTRINVLFPMSGLKENYIMQSHSCDVS